MTHSTPPHCRLLKESLQRHLEFLHSRNLTTEHDVECARRIEQFAAQHTDCFERSCVPGHITASALVFSNDQKKILLTHHRKLNKWLQLGGHCDGDTNPAQSAMREAVEESGLEQLVFAPQMCGKDNLPTPIDLDIHTIPARESEPSHLHLDLRYIIVSQSNADFVVSEESLDLKWFTLEEALAATREESMLRQLQRAFFILR